MFRLVASGNEHWFAVEFDDCQLEAESLNVLVGEDGLVVLVEELDEDILGSVGIDIDNVEVVR